MEVTVDTEARIFEAALNVFSMKGKDGARMQEIADEAGINKALLHYYFRSKDKLYDRVFEYVMSRLTRSLGAAMADAKTFRDVLQNFVAAYIDFVDANVPIMRLMVSEHLVGGGRVADRLKAAIESSEDFPPRLFLTRMLEAIERKEVRPVDPHQTLLTVLSSCIFFFIIFPTVEAIIPRASQDRAAFLEERKQHIFDVIWESLRMRNPA